MADTKAQLTASPAFHHLVARRWRVSLAADGVPVRPLLRLHPAHRRQQAAARRSGWAASTPLGIPLGAAVIVGVVGPDGGLRRLGEPPLRSRSATAARHASDSPLTRRHAACPRHVAREPDGFGRRRSSSSSSR